MNFGEIMKIKDKKHKHIFYTRIFFHLEYSGPIPVTAERQPLETPKTAMCYFFFIFSKESTLDTSLKYEEKKDMNEFKEQVT